MKKSLLIWMGILLVGIVYAQTVTQNVTVTVLPGAIDIYSPVQDAVYENRQVQINLSMSAQVLRFEYFEDGKRSGTLCRNCNEYGFSRVKRKPFDDGFHELTILAVFDSGTVYGYRNFTVDSKKPAISTTRPLSRKYTNGSDFYIKYTEENCNFISVNIFGIDNHSRTVFPCDSGRNIEKWIPQDLSLFDGQEIEFRIFIVDIVNNTDSSTRTTVKVDITPPKIINFDYKVDRRYVTFNMSIDEPNFYKVNYIDYNNTRPRWNNLCSSLKYGNCIVKKSFRAGSHNVTIQVLDKAGNSASRESDFEIA